MTLRGGDMRAAEKTYQLLYQVAGRAGREDANGTVYIQSYYPNNETILSLKEMDRNKFYKKELNYRKISQLPPIGKMAAIILSGHKKNEVDQICMQLLKSTPNIQDIEIYGPALPATWYNNWYVFSAARMSPPLNVISASIIPTHVKRGK